MKRRDFLKQSLSASALVAGAGYVSWDMFGGTIVDKPLKERAQLAAAKVLTTKNPSIDEGSMELVQSLVETIAQPNVKPHSRPALAYQQQRAETLLRPLPKGAPISVAEAPAAPIEEIVLTEAEKSSAENAIIAQAEDSASSLQEKITRFETNFTDDIILTEAEYKLMVQTLERVNRVQDYVGFGNFNVLSFDDALRYAKASPRIGDFTNEELDFMDRLFAYDSSRLGFFGEKVISKQTNVIPDKEIVKMPGTGHYVFRGHSEEFYNKLRSEVGESLILTSGVRNIIKQYQLFLAKTVQANGNLSRASRSLAPPGHSYHAIGDFDVGQVGGGYSNFTADFAETDEFKRLQDLGYVHIRYTADNSFGVRYEPWHIRVV